MAARRHDIHVLTAQLPPGEVELDLGDRVVPISGLAWDPRHPLFPADNALTFGAQLVRAWPTHEQWMLRPRLRAVKSAIELVERRRTMDLVHFTGPELASAASACRAPTSMLLFDVLSRHCQAELELAEDSMSRRRWALERRRAAVWERRWLSKLTSIAALTDVDAAAVEATTGGRPDIIPNPVPDAFYAPAAVPRSARTVSFVAFLSWRPNVDAVEWLADEIWPRVVAEVPDAELEVVGGKPDAAVVRAVERAGGRLDADVPDVRPYYWNAAVAVAPIRLGSGLRNKVLHAMACGAPMVATSAALEGIDARPGRELLVADDAPRFAAAIVSTLVDEEAAARRAAAALGLMERYRTGAVGASFEMWWQETVRRASRRQDQAPRRVAAAPLLAPSPQTATVVVCTRARPDLLRRSLPAVAKSVTARPGTDLTIVEQDTSYVEELCHELGIAASVVHDDGVGASRARNLGARHASGDVVLFTDDDCEVPDTWVADHLEALRHGEVTASFGDVQGLSSFEAPELPSNSKDVDVDQRPAKHWRGAAPWFVGHSANMAVRRATFVEVGGFDERIGPGSGGVPAGEDADLIVRLLHRGGAVMAGVGVPVRHLDWRSPDETERNLMHYERGAGVWIGKMLRADRAAGRAYLRARLDLLRSRAYFSGAKLTWRDIMLSLRELARGVGSGIRLGAWSPVGFERANPSAEVRGRTSDT